jgi:drug/metabolite transporter (DMT)-like permease
MWGFAFAAAFWAVVQPWWSFPWDTLAQTAAPFGEDGPLVPGWVLITWMVVLGTVVPFALALQSMRHIRATQASVIGMTEPVMASVVAFAFLGEVLTPVQILGGIVVLVGVVLAETSR